MTLGIAEQQGLLFDEVTAFCERTLQPNSIYAFLHRERDTLFPDKSFDELYENHGRNSIPPSVVATVMVLQRLEGCSDREAVDRYSFDVRWRYAAGAGGYDPQNCEQFVHSVLVNFRERLRRSQRPDRVFEAALEAAKEAGCIGRRRVVDSTALYDAVATMDTVTLIRSAIRGLVKASVAEEPLELWNEIRAVLRKEDDYSSNAKPLIDWENKEARAELIDAVATDGMKCCALLDDRKLSKEVGDAVRLIATVVGQDLDEGEDGIFRIARRVNKNRIISTVDTQTRHGHKTKTRHFDGYKGHIAIDPDTEIITRTVVTPGNVGDGDVAKDLIHDILPGVEDTEEKATVYGDSSYGSGEFQSELEESNIESRCKTQLPSSRNGMYSKEEFRVDGEEKTVTCPAEITLPLPGGEKGGTVKFGMHCSNCLLRSQCTDSLSGRTIRIGPYEEVLARARADRAKPEWKSDYTSTIPKVERKFAHLMRQKHGGRRSRVWGTSKVDADFRLLAAATNMARLAILKVQTAPDGSWVIAT